MLPKISFNELAVKTEKAVSNKAQLASSHVSSSTSKRPEKMPIIPPRLTMPTNAAPQTNDKPSWYVVISPRETRGLAGPYSVLQLKQMFKVGEVNDRTLVWREGEDDWQQLVNQSLLRSQLINLPILPPRIGNYNAELAVFDPVVELPKKSLVDTAILLLENDTSRLCTHCGALATHQIPNHGEHIPDLFKCRDEVGTTDSASEILPGFLWVGDSNSSKHRSILTLGVTMLINISENLKSPPQQIPFFRCKEMPLKENAQSFTIEEKMDLLGIFEQLYDWIEFERLSPERNKLSDAPAKPYRGPVDEFGFPIKNNEKPFRRPQADEGATFPSRVLVWSNDGKNRGCAVAITYLIRHYGISLDRATEIVKLNRPTIRLSPAYQDLVETWSSKYSMGIYLCLDCKTVGSSGMLEEKEENSNQLQDQEPKDTYDLIVVLFKGHLPKIIKDQKEKDILQPVTSYLTKIPMTYFQTSSWSGLMDLDLSNRRLSDMTLGLIFQMMGGNGAAKHLRYINLRNNAASFLAMKCLLLAFFPKVDADPEFDDYLDDEYDIDMEENYPSLTYLDVSHNKLDDQAVRFLCFFVQQCNSLVTLNVFNNNIEDPPLSDIIACFTTPLHSFDSPSRLTNKTDFYGNGMGNDDDSVSVKSTTFAQGVPYNRSVTDLNIGKNQFGPYSSKALILMMKQNVVLNHLTLDLCHGLDPPGIKKFTHAIRLYNSTLHELSFDGIELSVKSAEHIARIHESKYSQITKMKMAHCGFKHLHMAALAKYLPIAPYLTYLDLSGNPFGDKGAVFLAEIIDGKQLTRDNRSPPLNYLDISSCAIKAEGCEKIMTAISKRNRFKYVDISYNAIGSDNDAFFKALGAAEIEELHLNYCDLKSTGACKIFHVLSSYPVPEDSEKKHQITPVLRSLGMSGNEISDSVAGDLVRLLKSNDTLEIFDIGFNNFTDASASTFQEGIKVVSSDNDKRKTNELHINLVGNKCDPYLLDMPGMARAKINYRNGIQPNREDVTLGGYAQIESRARGKFLVQKQLDDQYRSMLPVKAITTIR